MNGHLYRYIFIFAVVTYYNHAEAMCTREYRIAAESELRMPSPKADFLQEITSDLGCKLRIVAHHTNHIRRLRMLELGEIDLMPEASWRQERTAFARYSIPYRSEITILIVLKTVGDQGITQLSDIYKMNKRILSLDQNWLGPEVQVQRELWRANHQLITYKDPFEGLRDLRMNRAEVMLCTDLIYYHTLQEPKDVQRLPFEVHRDPVHLMFSKKTVSEVEVAQFNVALKRWLETQPKPH